MTHENPRWLASPDHGAAAVVIGTEHFAKKPRRLYAVPKRDDTRSNTMTTHGIGMPSDLAADDTAPPPLPPWLKGFLVTSKNASDVRRAGEEVAKLFSDDYFKLAYDNLDVPASMVKPGTTEVPYEKAESLLIPGCPGSVFVALRPDTTTVNVRILAEGASRNLLLFSSES